MPYRDHFHDFVTKLLLRSNSLRNHESSPLFQAATGLQSSGHGPKAHEGNENHHFELIYLVATAEGQVTLTKSNFVKKGTLALETSLKLVIPLASLAPILASRPKAWSGNTKK